MLSRTIKRWLPAAVLATAAGWPANHAMAQEARAALGRPQIEQAVAGMSPELLEELRAMKRQLEELRHSDAAKAKQIEELQRRLERQPELRQSGLTERGPLLTPRSSGAQDQKQDAKSALDRAIQELESKSQPSSQESPLDRALRGLQAQPSTTPIASLPTSGGAQLQLLDISFDVLFASGTSTATEPQIVELQGHDHDPRKRGFTLQNAELFLGGAIDPYLDGAANIIYFIDPEGETIVELEEAYMTTRSLPCGLQFKAGQFFAEYGRINAQHPHTWHWIDAPIAATRIFGPDGMRGPGMRLSWLMPCEQYSEVIVGMQNANGETKTSFFASEELFDEQSVAGRPFVAQDVRDLGDLMYWARWQTSWTTCCEEATWLFGLSGAVGPNATGPDGCTGLYGVDLTMKWRPAQNERGWPFLIWETEFIGRHYRADNFADAGDPIDPLDDVVLDGRHLDDWGFYSQLLYGFKLRWAAGVRYEFVGGKGDSLDEDFASISRQDDPFRDDRHRFSPLVAWNPTEFSRFRLQYNYDHAEHLSSNDAHSFWLGMEWLYGAHAAHKF